MRLVLSTESANSESYAGSLRVRRLAAPAMTASVAIGRNPYGALEHNGALEQFLGLSFVAIASPLVRAGP